MDKIAGAINNLGFCLFMGLTLHGCNSARLTVTMDESSKISPEYCSGLKTGEAIKGWLNPEDSGP